MLGGPADEAARLLAAAAALLLALDAALACCFARWPAASRINGRSVLLVVAHPDDEAMFFAPTLRALAGSGAAVHILCLSAGAGGGRAGELLRAAASLGVAPDRVTTLAFRDGMAEQWAVGQAAAAVAAAAAAARAGAVVSFDAGGVTGHANHAATAAAVALFARHPLAPPCYALETVGPLRKFVRLGELARSAALHWLHGLLNTCTCGRRTGGAGAWCARGAAARVLVATATPLAAHVAMREHASQYVWHRVAFVWCSRYACVNTLRLLPRQRTV